MSVNHFDRARDCKGDVIFEKDNTAIPKNEHYVSLVDLKEQKRVLRKLDSTLLPFVSLLYLLSFL